MVAEGKKTIELEKLKGVNARTNRWQKNRGS